MAGSDDDDEGDDWQPEPNYILHMYNKLAKGESLALEWTLPVGGRRSPSPHNDDMEEDIDDASKEEEKMEEKRWPPMATHLMGC